MPSGTATIILFTGKRASEWPNLLAVQELYEIYEAQEKNLLERHKTSVV